MSVGFENPDDASIELAIEANDAFVDRLDRCTSMHTRAFS
jgi:hypothetical protein